MTSYVRNKKLFVFVFISLEFIECEPDRKTMNLRLISDLDNMLPTEGTCFVSEREKTGLVECSVRCSMTSCAGVYHHNNKTFCKPLRRQCNKNVLYTADVGWKFFSDIIGCDQGWTQYRDHCYRLSVTVTNWNDAVLQCQGQGAYLVEIESKEENDWINDNIAPAQCLKRYWECGIWTGGSDVDSEGSFFWSGSRNGLDFTYWKDEEPNNAGNTEHCLLILFPRERWIDGNCITPHLYLCEKSL